MKPFFHSLGGFKKWWIPVRHRCPAAIQLLQPLRPGDVSQFSEEALGGTKSAPWRATLEMGMWGMSAFVTGVLQVNIIYVIFGLSITNHIYKYIYRGTLIYEHLH